MTEEEKEYRDILIKYYTENHSFIEKAVFTVTASAITFLLGYSDKISTSYVIGYSICIGLFILTLIIQLYSAYISREGCDSGIGNPESEKSLGFFKQSERLNNTFMVLFCIAIIATSIVVVCNTDRVSENNSNYIYDLKAVLRPCSSRSAGAGVATQLIHATCLIARFARTEKI